MARALEPGALAPDFVLPGGRWDGETFTTGSYRLGDRRGHPLILAFYPQDNSAVCTRQMCSYSSGLEQFTDLGADVWAISPQGLDAHEEFARGNNLRMPLLADTERTAAKLFGVAAPGIGIRRSVFLIGPDGRVRWQHIALIGLTWQPVERLTAELSRTRA
ncbi:peroxiredoxin [Streptomyces sp. NPDC059743]|uniref:peroxiredoxin n=1 Tax=Streptomyces sp. NPDC059743 TaxID=3346928 RepID=UPI003654BBDE